VRFPKVLDSLREKVSQLKNALSVCTYLLATARLTVEMHADLLGHFLDHHGFQIIQALRQEITCAVQCSRKLSKWSVALLDIILNWMADVYRSRT